MELPVKEIPKRVRPKSAPAKGFVGRVYLVGAGPGDPDLLTVKAYRLLMEADVVLYDALVGERILDLIPEKVKKIFVGKRKGFCSLPQSGINGLLHDLVKVYKKVVRLKGGDPFIFGRGGEELLYLTERGIDVEVVPGVSSFYSAPSLFGIPLTHRGVASSFAVLTGHRVDERDFDWKSLKAIDTLVFMMAVSKRRKIARKLLDAGFPAKRAVALISKAYQEGQNLVLTDLETLAKNPPEVDSPAVMIVGEVVRLAKERSFQNASTLR